MKIGLYFGSFNPVHNGHLIIAQHILNETALNQVWMVVSPQNPFKSEHNLLNEYHRLHLLHIALENSPSIKATDVEFRLPKPSYTIDTLTYLKEKYPTHEFAIIMGSDSLQNLSKWKNAAVIINNPENITRRSQSIFWKIRAGLTRRVINSKLAATSVASAGDMPIKNAANNPPVINKLLVSRGLKTR